MNDKNSIVKKWKIFLNTMQKLSPKNFSPLSRNGKKDKSYHSVMTSMIMLDEFRWI